MRVLVTGGNGFIGSHVVRRLRAAGHDVRVLAQPGTSLRTVQDTGANVLWGDLRVPASLLAAVDGIEVVCHLAARVGDHGPASEYFDVNTVGTRRLVAAAKQAGVRRVVLVSTLAVHRLRGRGIPDGDENRSRDHVAMPYALSKILAEDEVMRAHAAGHVEGVVVRPGLFPFGPNDRTSFLPLVRNLDRYAHVGGGRAVFCTAYAENLAHGIALAAEHPAAAGRVYVVADDERPTWREFMDLLCDLLGRPRIRRNIPLGLALALAGASEAWAALTGRPPLLTRYRVRVAGLDCWFSSRRAREELGYVPLVDLGEGLRRTVAWVRTAG